MARILTRNGGEWSPNNETKSTINLSTIASMMDGTDKPATWKNFSSYGVAAQEAMVKNVIAGRCIQYISQAIASLDWVLLDENGDPIKKHPLLDLLKRPNPTQGTSAFFQMLQMHKLVAGSAYVRAIRPNKGKAPTELELLRPDRVNVNQGNSRLPISYTYTDTNYSITFDVNQINGACDILQIAYPHPTRDHHGLSPSEQAGRSIALHNEYLEFNKRQLENGASITGMVVVRDDLNEDGRRHLKEEFDRNHTGARNAGRPMFSTGDVDFKEMGQSNKDIEMTTGMTKTAIDIATAYGIGAQLVGIHEASTFNNVHEARLDAWEGCILPEADLLVSELNHWLAAMFGEGIELAYDKDKISALAPRRKEKVDTLVSLRGILSDDEIRQQLGYGPKEEEAPEMVEETVEEAPETIESVESEEVVEETVEEEKQSTAKIIQFHGEPSTVTELKVSEVTTVEADAEVVTEDIDAELTEEIKLQSEIDQFMTNIQESKFVNSDKKGREFEFKTMDIDFEELTESGLFYGYGAVFNNLDSHSDIIAPGAFKRTLSALESSGRQIPVYFNHDSSEDIGVYVELYEDDYGLFAKGKLDLTNERAQQVHTMMKAGQITGMSIGYVTIVGSRDSRSGVRVLKEVRLNEISIVNIPSNVLARVVEVKTHQE